MARRSANNPSLRYPVARPDLGGNESRYLSAALREGAISSIGPFVSKFETAFARELGVPHALAVSSGTAALHLALCALGIGSGDEVILPDLTFVASANAVRYTGAKVVLTDVDPRTWTLCPEQVERAITRRTRAILAVHLYGNPADLDALRRLARGHGLALIEDAAEAQGARWRGRAVGGLGNAGCFSFYGNKILTTGEGGMVVTRSARLASRIRHLRDHAMSKTRRYHHDELGFNYRMSALQAAVGMAQLERLSPALSQRERIRRWYDEALDEIEGLATPLALDGAEAANWLYTFAIDGWSRRQRDATARGLRQAGIDSRPVFVPMSRLPMYASRRSHPAAARLADAGLSLPTYTQLRRSDVRVIAGALRHILSQRQRRRPKRPRSGRRGA